MTKNRGDVSSRNVAESHRERRQHGPAGTVVSASVRPEARSGTPQQPAKGRQASKSISDSAKHMLRSMLKPRKPYGSKQGDCLDASQGSSRSNGGNDSTPTVAVATASSATVTTKRRRQSTRITGVRSTNILLPTREQGPDGVPASERVQCSVPAVSETKTTPTDTHFTLPVRRPQRAVRIDRFVAERYPELVRGSSRHFTSSVKDFAARVTERVVYVGQRELAHATQAHAEWIVTHRATTCHILAVRSSAAVDGTVAASSISAVLPLSTLTHIDAPRYTDCVKRIFETHLQHHRSSLQRSSTAAAQTLPTHIQMDLHVAGGFDDPKDKSRPLSVWLLHTLADLAYEYRDSIVCTLRHCLVSKSNTDCADNGPFVRGMAIDTRTGQVFRVRTVAEGLLGPHPVLRQARLWSSSTSSRNPYLLNDGRDPTQILSVVYNGTSPTTAAHYTLQPFWFALDPDLEWLLDIDDDREFISYTSTSPDHEDDVAFFCSCVRRTLTWMTMMKPEEVFQGGRSALYYQRSGPNQWEKASLPHIHTNEESDSRPVQPDEGA